MSRSSCALVLQFALLMFQWFEASSVGCGRQVIKEPRQPKVVGGNDTYEGEFPWVVSIRKNGNHHCGGVIVGQRWILTAAHCVQNQVESNFAVRVGEHDLMRNEKYSRDYNVQQIFIHHNYSRMNSFKNWANINNADIALIKTVDDIHWSEYAWPVCFPPSNVQLPGQEAVVIGWGKRSEKSDFYSERLQKVKLTIVDGQQCAQWFKLAGRDFVISDQILCAGYKDGGRDACHGDSGGPLLLKQKQNNGVDFYTVAGIVSTGIVQLIRLGQAWNHERINRQWWPVMGSVTYLCFVWRFVVDSITGQCHSARSTVMKGNICTCKWNSARSKPMQPRQPDSLLTRNCR